MEGSFHCYRPIDLSLDWSILLALYVLLGMFPVTSIEQNDGLRSLMALSIEGKYTFPSVAAIRKELDDLAEKTSGAIQQILLAPKTVSLNSTATLLLHSRGSYQLLP